MVGRMETIDVQRDGGIATITLRRPHRKNAMSAAMFRELRAAFREVSADPEVRVLVVTGAEGEFCSGADLAEDDEDGRGHPLQWMRQVGECAAALHHVPQPVIAKVRGVAAGAGLNLALGCDLVVAADTARFSEIFARRGLSVDFGGSWLLPRRIGLHKAKELVLLADIISAAEAEAIGLVNRVVPEHELDAFVDDWARRLAAGPPLALGSSKRLLDASAAMSMDQALEAEALAQATNLASADVAEAFLAFREKRDATFQGR
jgi:2-(1,2-epoxy-1,2-dihydrophenyl)acetyl-CoA isomerase